MSNKYQLLLTINFEHEYYSNNGFPNVELIPDPKTTKFLKNHRILFKKKENKFFLLQDGLQDEENWSPIIEINPAQRLFFYLKVNDSLFQNKTAVEFYANKDSKLCIESIEGDQRMELLPFIKKPILLDNRDSPESSTFSLRDFKGDLVIEKLVQGGDTDTLRPQEPGVYELFQNNSIISRLLYGLNDRQYEGIVMANLSSSKSQEFNITFKARKIKWRYSILSKYLKFNNEKEQVILKEEDHQLKFESSDEHETNRICFNSESGINLKDKLNYSFFIEIDGEKRFSGIGAPSIKNIFKDKKGNYFLIKYLDI